MNASPRQGRPRRKGRRGRAFWRDLYRRAERADDGAIAESRGGNGMLLLFAAAAAGSILAGVVAMFTGTFRWEVALLGGVLLLDGLILGARRPRGRTQAGRILLALNVSALLLYLALSLLQRYGI